MVLKKGWTMILKDEGIFDGVYVGDLRVFKKFDVSVNFAPIRVFSKDGREILYLTKNGEVVGLLEKEYYLGESRLEISFRLVAFKDGIFRVYPDIEQDHSDLMSLRGFPGAEVRVFDEGGWRVAESVGMDLRWKVEIFGAGEKTLKKKEEASGKLVMEYDVKVKGRTAKVLSDMKSDGLQDLSSLNSDLEKLAVFTRYGAVPAAGLPWYSAIFGRDLLVFGLQILDHDPSTVERILLTLAALMGEKRDPELDEEPGKIPHEARLNPSGFLYYGSVDSTLLFVFLVSEYYKRTKSVEFLKSIKEEFLRALNWCLSASGGGFLRYQTSGILRNKGWKDSDEAIVHKNGEIAEGPIALVEVQAYLYAAFDDAAEIVEELGLEDLSFEIEKRAQSLREKFLKEFETDDYFATAIDGRGRKVESVTSNPAHAMYFGIYPPQKAEKVVSRIMEEDMLTPFGIRTMSSLEKAYNPVSYHNGSIWPHDNWFMVMGMMRYGYKREALELARRVLEVSKHFGGKLPELYVYIDGVERPLPYPNACEPQLWAVGTQISFEKLLGR